LGYKKYDSAGDSRNGYSEKTVYLENRQAVIQTPQDRNGTFGPAILPKRRKRAPLFKGRIIPMYSFGMANRDVKSRLEQVCNVEVPPELASRVADTVTEDAGDWRSRPLGKSYAVVYPDALRVNSRKDGKSCQKSVYAALGVNSEGKKEGGKRGGEIPGAGAQWDTQPGDRRHPDSAHGRALGIPGRGAGRVSPNTDTAVYRTHGAQLRAVRLVQGFEGGLRGAENSIPRAGRRGWTGGP
jgi:hypothetical protein